MGEQDGIQKYRESRSILQIWTISCFSYLFFVSKPKDKHPREVENGLSLFFCLLLWWGSKTKNSSMLTLLLLLVKIVHHQPSLWPWRREAEIYIFWRSEIKVEQLDLGSCLAIWNGAKICEIFQCWPRVRWAEWPPPDHLQTCEIYTRGNPQNHKSKTQREIRPKNKSGVQWWRGWRDKSFRRSVLLVLAGSSTWWKVQ